MTVTPSSRAQAEVQLTDPLQTNFRLRAILASWYQSPRYRSEASTQDRNHPVPSARQTELNREFKEGWWFTGWQWFVVPLFVLTIIDFFYLRMIRG
jgi:hypothetical protein